MADFTVGQKVRAREAIYEPADDYAPGGYLCSKGDILVVRKVDARQVYPIKVSHEDVTDRSFGAKPEEIEAVADGVTTCPACNGSGDHGWEGKCETCDGKGTVPAGVRAPHPAHCQSCGACPPQHHANCPLA